MNYNGGMLNSPSRRTLTTWIAALAILFSALAPSISHALSMSRGDSALSAICSAAGVKQLPAFAADTSHKPVKDVKHNMEHCPYCATHGGSFALLPPVPITFAVVGGHDLFPCLYYQAPSPLFVWSAAQPRGPPTIS